MKNTERTQKYSLHQFSTKFTHAELVKTRALFAESANQMPGPATSQGLANCISIQKRCLW